MKTKPLQVSVYFYFYYNLLKLTQKELFTDLKKIYQNFSKESVCAGVSF